MTFRRISQAISAAVRMLHMLMIDMLELHTSISLQKSLQQLSASLALQSKSIPESLLGLCAIKYPTAKDVQLQVLAEHIEPGCSQGQGRPCLSICRYY